MSSPAPKLDDAVTIIDAVHDPDLFAPWFERGEWQAWFAFLAALFALPMDTDQHKTFKACTKRTNTPEQVFKEAWLVVGRRGGKSFIVALIAVFLAAFFDYRQYLQKGERGTILILAADRKQARVILRYVRALFTEVPLLRELVERETAEGMDLTNRITIEIGTASFRSVRSGTIVAALCDEIAYWRSDDSANPDYEILNAIRPGMATIPNGMLLALSSPYAKRGELYNAHKQFYGKNNPDILVWQADTQTMNPTVPERVIKSAYDRDASSAAAEYGAQFRADIESFIARETVEACTVPGRYELPYLSEFKYRAFVDPSGGSNDSMTLAIGHDEDQNTVVDAIREVKPPFSPEAVVKDFANLLREYRISRVEGDRYAGEWPRERFSVHKITYDVAAKPRSDLYRDMLPLLNSKRVELLDSQKLVNQICSLERRTARGGKDSIDHPPGGHDDIANAVAGLLAGSKKKGPRAGCW